MKRKFMRITVEVPAEAGPEVQEAIFTAVSDAAYDEQPEDRKWDIFVYAVGNVEEDWDE